VLVVAATREEARYVPEGLPLLVTGLGKVAAAASLAGWLGAATPLEPGFEVINIGTAGALRDGVSGLHLPGRVINHDVSAEVLAGMGIKVEDSLGVEGGSDVVLATGDSFIADPVTREALAQRPPCRGPSSWTPARENWATGSCRTSPDVTDPS
jgi:hypothetical protein